MAHEGSQHAYPLLSKENQPYQDAGYPIFLAEIASTVNETLLFSYQMKRAASKGAKAADSSPSQDIVSTFFRQTQFAHFERDIHDMVSRHSLTARGSPHYADVKRYYGPDMQWEEDLRLEAFRIPHFYYNFYVYQYAMGICAAYQFANKLLMGQEEDRKRYLQFLASGSSRPPMETPKGQG